jgi:aminoglycoside phosphotransferase family enzyme
MNPTRMLFLGPVLALAIAGCGNSEQNDFVDGYNTATAPLTQLTTSLSGAPSEESLDKMADGLEDVRTKLAELDAPDGAQDELDRMLASLEANTAQVRKMSKAVKSEDIEQLTAATQEFSTKGAELVQAEEALRKAVEG